MNISNDTIEQLDAMFFTWFSDDNYNIVPADKATLLHIVISKEDQSYIGKNIKATKKETTVEYIMSKLNADKVYTNFSNIFKSLLPAEHRNSLNVYPTSYGIGCFVVCGFRSSIEQTKQLVESIMAESGIHYTNEYSQAGWVFRYKISKSKENIDQINKYINLIEA